MEVAIMNSLIQGLFRELFRSRRDRMATRVLPLFAIRQMSDW